MRRSLTAVLALSLCSASALAADTLRIDIKGLDGDLAANARAWVDTLPRFALRPAALDQGRYARFEAFLHAAGLVTQVRPVSDLAVDLGAQ